MSRPDAFPAGGVRALLEEWRAEVEEALALAGATSPTDAGPDLVVR